jgi:hypothetical protein
LRRPGAIAAALTLALASCGALPAASPAAGGRSPAPRAPTGSPLVSGSSAYEAPRQPVESEAESAAASEDPLVRNGLRSPLCALPAAELPAAGSEDCRTSGFLAASTPSQNYSFDTNIDTAFGSSGLGVDPLLQDYLVRPAWTALVWLVHGLIVGLEWSYTLDLLRGPLTGNLEQALRSAEAQLTRPLLASALALAAILAAYDGLVRRRVAQTLGEAAATLAMIAAAMLVIADPGGTIGAVAQLAEEASVGAFGAVQDGNDPQRPYVALGASIRELYAASIEAPWCFLEFGDVSWCEQPRLLDPRLRRAASRIASQSEAQAGESGHDGPGGEALRKRALLLRGARTNGGIFLALPANGLLRNSVKDEESLLSVLCGGGGDATRCRGPTAAQAEFRTGSGTLPRIGGVCLIALGVLGLLLLLGFLTMRLLEAALFSVLLLLLAPAAALAPVWGESGRAAFRGWASRLLAAVTAKLLWSLVLGALLMTLRLLLTLEGIGWLAQWLLMSALWWGAFLQRHRLLARGGGRVRLVAGRGEYRSDRGGQAPTAIGRRAGRDAWRRATSRSSRRLRSGHEQPGESQRRDAGEAGVADEVAATWRASRLPASVRREGSGGAAHRPQPADAGGVSGLGATGASSGFSAGGTDRGLGAAGANSGPGASSYCPWTPIEIEKSTDPVMRDAFAVAEGRQNWLGWSFKEKRAEGSE